MVDETFMGVLPEGMTDKELKQEWAIMFDFLNLMGKYNLKVTITSNLTAEESQRLGIPIKPNKI